MIGIGIGIGLSGYPNQPASGGGGVEHDIVWANLTNASVIGGNQLEMSADGWTGGGSSSESLAVSDGGYIANVIVDPQTTPVARQRMFGFGATNIGGGFGRINFAAYLEPPNGASVEIKTSASGAIDGTVRGVAVADDEVRLVVDSFGVVTITLNGDVIYTFGATASGVLYANGACFNNGAALENLRLSGTFH